ncbi:AEC family transporter [Desulfopila sp. IMCC35008]|uniref:AEC family transporter n=1 Tax=Desulfopila sp. IMCC35008 TaxID=2653858 RepID=UPI0013D5DE2E|nr:AEC family transporter [Desulfopila sp. IMCC35008]
MVQLTQILLIVFPVFLVIGLGFALQRTNLFSRDFTVQLNRLIFYVALPALLFHKISSANFTTSFNGQLLFGLLVSMAVVFLASYLYGLIRGYPAPRLGAFCQASFRSNAAYIGVAIVFSAYGEEGLAVAGIIIGFFIPMLNFLSVVALLLPQRNGDTKPTAGIWLQQLGLNPLILACLAGISWSLLELPKPTIMDRTLDIVTGMALPLALLSIGASFSMDRLKGDIKVVAMASLFKIVVMPFVAVVLLKMFGLRGQDLGIGFILAGAPTAAAAFVMAQQLNNDAELSGSIIMVSTLFSLVTYTGGLYLLSFLQL